MRGMFTRCGVVVVASIAVGCASRPSRSDAPLTGSGDSSELAHAPNNALSTDARPSARPDEREISRTLDDWHDAAARADEARYFAHFSEGAVFLGTDATERWTVPQFRTYAHPHFARGTAWTMRATRREITYLGDTAWFDEDLQTLKLGPARGTGVLVRAGNQWKIAQYNLSIPIPNERFKEVRALLDTPGAPPAPAAPAPH